MKLLKQYIFFILFGLTTTSYAQDFIISGPQTSGRHYIYGTITIQGTTLVESGVDIDLAAKTFIKFKPGFKVEQGGKLRAAVSPDTDGDLILDILEQRSGCENFTLADTDGDGLSDGAEDANHNGFYEPELNETRACSKDTDGDGMDDGWEVSNRLNPLADDSEQDPDGDGLSNYYEYYFHSSDPRDPNSLPLKGAYYEYDELGRIKKIIRIN